MMRKRRIAQPSTLGSQYVLMYKHERLQELKAFPFPKKYSIPDCALETPENRENVK
jgi:hypothetical protein